MLKEQYRLRYILICLFTTLTFSLFIFIALSHYNIIKKSNQQYFEKIVEQTEKSILKRYALYELAIIGGLGLFHASNEVDQEEWKKYAQTIDVVKNLPGINGIGYIEYYNTKDFETHESGVGNNNKDKFIVKYFFPEKRSEGIIGLDIGSSINGRIAAEKSRDTGHPVLTQKISFSDKSNQKYKFLLLVPFYNEIVGPLSSVQERRENIVGGFMPRL